MPLLVPPDVDNISPWWRHIFTLKVKVDLSRRAREQILNRCLSIIDQAFCFKGQIKKMMIMIHFIKMDWTSVSREYFSLCMILCVLWITSEHGWAKPKAHFLKCRLMCKVLWKSNVSLVNIWYKNVSIIKLLISCSPLFYLACSFFRFRCLWTLLLVFTTWGLTKVHSSPLPGPQEVPWSHRGMRTSPTHPTPLVNPSTPVSISPLKREW